MSLRQKTISGVKWTTISTVTQALAGLIKIAVLTRFLDKSDFGLMALVMLVLGFLRLFMDLGLTQAILHKQNISDKEYASLFWINIVISLLLFSIVWTISPVIASFYEQPELSILIPLMGISIVFSGLGQQFKTIEQKELNFRYLATIDILGGVIGLILGIVLAIKGFGVYALVYAALAQYTISYSIYFVRGLFTQGVLIHFTFAEAKPFLNIGLYYTGGQVINYFSRDLDILLIGKFFSTDILGSYSLAKQLVQKPARVLNPIFTKVASPVLAVSQGNIIQLKKQFLSFLNVISTINLTTYSLVAALAYPIVIIIYGSDYSQIVIIVQILSAYAYLRSIGDPIGSLVIATGKTSLDFLWNLIVLFVTPIAIVIGSFYGINGVAISIVLGMIALFIPLWRFLVYEMTSASLREYVKALIPDFLRIIKLIKENTF